MLLAAGRQVKSVVESIWINVYHDGTLDYDATGRRGHEGDAGCSPRGHA